MSNEEFEKQLGIPPYKATAIVKQATKIVDNLVTNSTSFTRPCEEAKLVLQIATILIDKMIDLKDFGKDDK